jgi:WD40 repeat protein
VDYHPEQILRGHLKSVYKVIQLNDSHICSAGEDKSIKIWSPESLWTQGQCDKTLREHTGTITSLIQLRDGRVCSGSEDKSLKVCYILIYSPIHLFIYIFIYLSIYLSI